METPIKRNMFSGIGSLLIAPIWNGNLDLYLRCPSIEIPFNRTNLEWKLGIEIGSGLIHIFLLIAPIWNGNENNV